MAFPELVIDFNLKDDSLYVQSYFKLLEVPFLQKLKNEQKN